LSAGNLSNLFVYATILILLLALITYSVALGGGEKAQKNENIGTAFTWLAFGVLFVAVVLRGVSSGRAPWGNMYEFAITSALAILGAFLFISLKKEIKYLGVFVVLPTVLLLGLAVTVLYTESGPLVPALRSGWLVVHVSAAIISYGAFSVNFALSLIILLRNKFKLIRIPENKKLDELAYRTALFAFPIWTFSVIAGAIWAENAWGRYWGWDPKETWAFITWIIYAAYLHARVTRDWSGNKSAWIAVAAYSSIVFNFFGVNLWITGLHSYAGV
jgi:cytochrome c-type biogenesis protein CcsB